MKTSVSRQFADVTEANIRRFQIGEIGMAEIPGGARGQTDSSEELPPLLRHNLEALARTTPPLFDRLCLPVDDANVVIDQHGRPFYRVQRSLLPLSVTTEQLQDPGYGEVGSKLPLLFGVGLGEQLQFILQNSDASTILAWDRDPWLIRLLLSKLDLSDAISSGRIQFALGPDLFALLKRRDEIDLITHPVLGEIYRHEKILFREGIRDKRALLTTGTLFVDDLAESLRAEGFSVYLWDIKRLAREELTLALRQFDPQVIVAVNYTYGLTELCAEEGRPLIVWEVDPAVDQLRPCEGDSSHAFIFAHSKTGAKSFQRAGFENVRYQPLATNPDRRYPAKLSELEESRYRAPVSFVGASMLGDAAEKRQQFVAFYKALCAADTYDLEKVETQITEIIEKQLRNPQKYIVDSLVEARFAQFSAMMRSAGLKESPEMLLAESAASEYRRRAISALVPFGIEVWGDAGWQETKEMGVRYRGPAGHYDELTKIYSATEINIDIARLYQPDLVNMRVFDILGCGGFLLTARNEALEDLFEIGEELEVYESLEELVDKTRFFLAHPNARDRIAQRGRETVLRSHTVNHRLREMLTDALRQSNQREPAPLR